MKVPVAAAVTPRERRLRPLEYSNADPLKRFEFAEVAATLTSTWMAGMALSPTVFSGCLSGFHGNTPGNRRIGSFFSALDILAPLPVEERLPLAVTITSALGTESSPE
jgi:hypothetical protein